MDLIDDKYVINTSMFTGKCIYGYFNNTLAHTPRTPSLKKNAKWLLLHFLN